MVACDEEEALLRCFDPDRLTTERGQHFDLIIGIRKLVQQSPLQWSFKHVYGHQDDNPYATLDRWATLNVEMDLAAKAYWHETAGLPVQRSPNTAIACWEVSIGGDSICRNLDLAIKDHCCSKGIVEYWTKKKRYGSRTSQDIDREAMGDAMREVPKGRRHWITKHSAGECGVGTVMVKRKERDVPDCPRCGREEDAPHVRSCRDEAAIDRWTNAIANM